MKKVIIAGVTIVALGLGIFGAYKAIGSIIGPSDKVDAAPVTEGQAKAEGAPAPAKLDENTMNIPIDDWRAATEEYINSPFPIYDPKGMPEIVGIEFGSETPKTLHDLMIEVGRMFRGESHFNSSRAQAIEYLAQTEPIVSEVKKLGKPFPNLIFPQDHPDLYSASAQARDQFKAYVRAYLGLPPTKQPRTSLSSEQHDLGVQTIRKVEAGELPDERLVDAGPLIRRMIQDIEDPQPNSIYAKMTQQQRDDKLKYWKDLFDRMEASRVAP